MENTFIYISEGGNKMKMRKMLALGLASAMAVSLAACGGSASSSEAPAASEAAPAASEAPAATEEPAASEAPAAEEPAAEEALFAPWPLPEEVATFSRRQQRGRGLRMA